jgi:hypothetical protein
MTDEPVVNLALSVRRPSRPSPWRPVDAHTSYPPNKNLSSLGHCYCVADTGQLCYYIRTTKYVSENDRHRHHLGYLDQRRTARGTL